jgi:broad specificity phosphatase PhoE
MLPKNLVFVRHGQSEANVFHNSGKDHPGREEFSKTPDWQVRLTDKGREQAHLTGNWIKRNFPESFFGEAYVSKYVRARETAGHLGLGLKWKESLFLIERDAGLFHAFSAHEQAVEKEMAKRDPFFHKFGKGTGLSIADLTVSTQLFFDTLHRVGEDKSVIAVCHGERMSSILYSLTRMTPETFGEWLESDDPLTRIFNCQVMHYTRENPDDPSDIRDFPSWLRSVCPVHYSRKLIDTGWREIERKTFSDQELLDGVKPYRRFLES